MANNPWESDPAFINLGGLKHVLDTYKRFSNAETQFNSDDHTSSGEFFELLRSIAQLNQEQAKVNIALQSQRLYQEFYNVLHTDVLDGMVSMVDFLSKHLQQIIDHKHVIVDQLQKPFVGEYLAIDAEYHSDICEFFPQIADQLANLNKTLHTVEWVNKYSVRNSNITANLEVIMSALSVLQKQYQAINETRDLMNDLIKMKT